MIYIIRAGSQTRGKMINWQVIPCGMSRTPLDRLRRQTIKWLFSGLRTPSSHLPSPSSLSFLAWVLPVFSLHIPPLAPLLFPFLACLPLFFPPKSYSFPPNPQLLLEAHHEAGLHQSVFPEKLQFTENSFWSFESQTVGCSVVSNSLQPHRL